MKTSIKENIKRNITLGGIILTLVTLGGWVWASAQFQKEVKTHMKDANTINLRQDKSINQIKNNINKASKDKRTIYVPRKEFEQVVKRLDEKSDMSIELLREIRREISKQNNKK